MQKHISTLYTHTHTHSYEFPRYAYEKSRSNATPIAMSTLILVSNYLHQKEPGSIHKCLKEVQLNMEHHSDHRKKCWKND